MPGRIASQISEPPFRAFRLARGWSQDYVATRAQLDPSYYSRIERGERMPSVEVLRRLATVLGMVELTKLLQPYQKAGRGHEMVEGEDV